MKQKPIWHHYFTQADHFISFWITKKRKKRRKKRAKVLQEIVRIEWNLTRKIFQPIFIFWPFLFILFYLIIEFNSMNRRWKHKYQIFINSRIEMKKNERKLGRMSGNGSKIDFSFNFLRHEYKIGFPQNDKDFKVVIARFQLCSSLCFKKFVIFV